MSGKKMLNAEEKEVFEKKIVVNQAKEFAFEIMQYKYTLDRACKKFQFTLEEGYYLLEVLFNIDAMLYNDAMDISKADSYFKK